MPQSRKQFSFGLKSTLVFSGCILLLSVSYLLAGHTLIDAMYHGNAVGYLNNVTKSIYPLEHYLTKGDWFVSGFIVCLFALWLLSLIVTAPGNLLRFLYRFKNQRGILGLTVSLLFAAALLATTFHQPLTPLGLLAGWLALFGIGLLLMQHTSPIAMGRLACTTLLAVLSLFCVFFLFKDPQVLDHVFDEDRFGENLSALLLFFSSGVFFYLFIAAKNVNNRNRFHLLFALFLFFVAAEEISWGQRILGLETPEVLEELSVQGEISLHTIQGIESNLVVTLLLLFVGIAIPLANAVSGPLQTFIRRIRFPVFSLMACAAALLGLIFDLIWRAGYYHQADEIRELFLYIGFLILTINAFINAQPGLYSRLKAGAAVNQAQVSDGKKSTVIEATATAMDSRLSGN